MKIQSSESNSKSIDHSYLRGAGERAVPSAAAPAEHRSQVEAAAASPSPEPLTEHRSGWVQLYATAVLGASQPPSTHATAAFNRVLCGASEEEWRTTLLPAATRALKRTPDAAIVALTALLAALPPTLALDADAAAAAEA